MTDPQFASAGPILYGIPLALWVAISAVVFAPIIAFIGVLVSNRNTRNNLEVQLAHDADQRDRERTMALRREVYLEAAAALAHVNAVVGRLADISNDQKALAEEFQADLARIAKVHIVGSPRTVQAVMNYVGVIGPSFAELAAKRVPLIIRKSAIDLESTFMDAAQAERKRFSAMTQQLNLEGVTDAEKWDPINRQSAVAAETYKSHAEIRRALWAEQLKDTFALARDSLAVAERVIPLLPAAILGVRSEMDAPLDPEWYAGLWAEQLANMRQVTGRLLEELKRINAPSSVGEASAKPT